MALCLTFASEGRWARAAEDEELPDNVITLEPLAVVYARTIALEYERAFGPIGIHVGAAFTLGDFDGGGQSGDYLAIGGTLGVRFYPWSDSPAGAFVGPFGSLAWVEAKDGDTRTEGMGWSVGAMVGWTWVFGSVFAFSLGGGAAWYDYTVDGTGGRDAVGRSGVYPALRLAVGVAF
jgi:hypothetical protein